MNQEQLSPEWDCYYDAFIRDAHQMLVWGYDGAKNRISADDEEPAITGLIVAAIEDKLNDVDTPDYYDKYQPHENKPDNKTGRKGKHRPMPDIMICFSGCRPRMEFYVEAKRLRANGFPIGEYIGEDGLQCFLRGDYACDCLSAAMIAYIQSDTPERWFTQLDNRFSSDTSKSLGIKTELGQTSVLSDLPHEWVSEHSRNDSTNIRIYHIFLDCCKQLN
ncbi:MAG: hypothetical protein ACYC64_06885 [Armatimonadota bacterium]